MYYLASMEKMENDSPASAFCTFPYPSSSPYDDLKNSLIPLHMMKSVNVSYDTKNSSINHT